MDNLFQNFYLSYLLVGVLKSLRYISILQKNWYRFDKLKDFLIYQKGLFQITSLPNILAAAVLAYCIYALPHMLQYAVWFALVAEVITFITSKSRKPRVTIKTMLLFVLSLGAYALFPIQMVSSEFFAYAILGFWLFTFFLNAIVFAPISKLLSEILFVFAKIKIANSPGLTVVGITGSYGKSSTKEFIYELIKDDFKTLKTPRNINTEIGIAKLILTKLKKHHQVLVLEMGAMSKGEIKKMCQIAPPKVAILTAVDSQHLSLFGSLENLAMAKSEILLHMHPDAKAFVNLDSPGSKKALKYVFSKSPLDMRIETYGQDPKSRHLLTDVTMKSNKVRFHLDKKSYHSELYGVQFAHNLSAAILAAQAIGLKPDALKSQLAKIDNSLIETQLLKHSKGFYILNDSYNSNQVGFMAALTNLEQTDSVKNKYLLTSGMFELGAKSGYYHRKVFKQAAKTCDVIVLTKPHLKKYLPANFKKYKIAKTPKEIISYLDLNLKKDDILLIEGRTFQAVKDKFIQ